MSCNLLPIHRDQESVWRLSTVLLPICASHVPPLCLAPLQGEHLRRRQGWEEWILPHQGSPTSASETASSSQGEADNGEDRSDEEQRNELGPVEVNEEVQVS